MVEVAHHDDCFGGAVAVAQTVVGQQAQQAIEGQGCQVAGV